MKKKTIEKPLKWAELLSRPYYTQADKEYYLQFIGQKIHSISLLPPQTLKIGFSGALHSLELCFSDTSTLRDGSPGPSVEFDTCENLDAFAGSTLLDICVFDAPDFYIKTTDQVERLMIITDYGALVITARPACE